MAAVRYDRSPATTASPSTMVYVLLRYACRRGRDRRPSPCRSHSPAPDRTSVRIRKVRASVQSNREIPSARVEYSTGTRPFALQSHDRPLSRFNAYSTQTGPSTCAKRLRTSSRPSTTGTCTGRLAWTRLPSHSSLRPSTCWYKNNSAASTWFCEHDCEAALSTKLVVVSWSRSCPSVCVTTATVGQSSIRTSKFKKAFVPFSRLSGERGRRLPQ